MRLESAAPLVGGKLEGLALKTAQGELTLIISDPKKGVIDTTKFTAAVASPHMLNVVPADEPGIQLKQLRPVAVEAPGYRVTASDEPFAKAMVTAALLEKLRALDEAAKARTRLFLAKGSLTLLTRGMTHGEDMKAFHDGCAAVVAHVRASAIRDS